MDHVAFKQGDDNKWEPACPVNRDHTLAYQGPDEYHCIQCDKVFADRRAGRM